MSCLLLDLGNSCLKWTFAAASLGEPQRQRWPADGLSADLVRTWRGHARPQRVLAASVTAIERRNWIDRALASLGWPQAEWLASPARHGGIVNAYRQPQKLGIDRFLSMLAADRAGHAPCVVAACGTALTLDALAADGRHLGGQIVPGLHAMLQGLARAAPGLPVASKDCTALLAGDSADAIATGARHALAGAIEHFAAGVAPRISKHPALVLCGGDAAIVNALLRRPGTVLDDAVLRGLLAWANEPQHPVDATSDRP